MNEPPTAICRIGSIDSLGASFGSLDGDATKRARAPSSHHSRTLPSIPNNPIASRPLRRTVTGAATRPARHPCTRPRKRDRSLPERQASIHSERKGRRPPTQAA